MTRRCSNAFATLIALLTSYAQAAAQGWDHYGGDAAGRRYVANAIVDTGNVARLAPAWQFRSGDATDGDDYFDRPSHFKATPVLFDGKLVFPTGFNRVIALDPVSGKQLWTFDPAVDFSVRYSEMFTARGVSGWQRSQGEGPCSRRIFLGTLDARLIAIDADDGKKCGGFGNAGEIDLSAGIANFRRGEYGLTSPVTVIGDIVVVGSSIGDNGGVELEPGTVRAYSAVDGEPLWEWDPVPRSKDVPGADSWPGNYAGGGANVWSVMSADPVRKLVFLPTTSPSPDFYGGVRPGNNRFANSVVALDAITGLPAWDFQTVHHDLWDYDIASQPLLTDVTRGDETVPIVVQATKMGHVFVLHRDSGEPIFPVEERKVPQSDAAGETAAATQPFPVLPPPLHAGDVAIWDFSEEHAEFCRDLLDGVRYDGIFTPPGESGTLLFPGNGGGTNWGSMAAHPEQDVAVLAVNRLPTVVTLIPREEFAARRNAGGGVMDTEFTAQSGTPYGMARHEVYNPRLTLPCLEGPWGELIALDLRSGQLRWRSPLDVFPGLEDHPQAAHWGSLAFGGPMITSTGIVFIASHFGSRLLAYRLDDGGKLWSADLPARPAATPMSYVIGDTQYVVIAAGGAVPGSDIPGDYLIAFSLERDAGVQSR